MFTRGLSLVVSLLVAGVAAAQSFVVEPPLPQPPVGTSPLAGSSPGSNLVMNEGVRNRNLVGGWPIYAPYGWYSPYPGIWNPIPYPGNTYPPHWIWNYMTFDEPVRHGFYRRPYDRLYDRDTDAVTNRAVRGRDDLYPAVPYSDYLKDQKGLLKSAESAKPAPTPTQALLEIRMPRENAKLYFDGKESDLTGETRIFLTPPLTPGANYTFTLKATWPGPIEDMTNEETITFRAGERKVVDLRQKN